MNRVELVGRLTRDPELRYTESNLAVCSFSIAVHRQFKNEETGDYDVDFINCKAFKKRAETIAKYCEKGDLVGVEGSIRTGSYEKEGQRIYTTEIIADNVDFLSPKQNTQSEEKTEQNETKIEEPNYNAEDVFAQFGEENFDDDGIAF